MKIILMGQQAFGKSALEKFHKETDHDVVAVYCAPDKEGKPVDPVKDYAQSVGLPVFQPSNFKDKEVLDQNIFVKVRSTGNLLEAKVDLRDHNTAHVCLAKPEDGISPGQACVFYNKDSQGYKVLGGGWIKE